MLKTDLGAVIEMDADTKAVLLELCQFCQGTLESASQVRLMALRVHEALISARVPSYLDAYESTEEKFAGLEGLKTRTPRFD